jgi:uncharacterized iron-regulated membrane protein
VRPVWAAASSNLGVRLVWRGLAWLHRWAGVVLSVLFAMWFATGAVMVFVPWPSLPEAQRLAGRQPIDLSRLTIAPAEILHGDMEASAVRLIGLEGRPVYAVSHPNRDDLAWAADTGEALAPLDPEAGRRIAEAFQKWPARTIEGPLFYDQWIVPNGYDRLRPFFRISFGDDPGTTLYVSQRTGEVLQRTTHNQRVWNTLGAVLHWLYFTPIRRSWEFWDALVWWVSASGMGLTVTGLVLGVYRFQAMRGRALSPYRSWLKWHHIAGLFAGVFILTWIFSGWLSMDHGRLFSTGEPNALQVRRMAGAPLAASLAPVSGDVLKRLDDAVEVRFDSVASEPIITVIGREGAPVVYTLVQNDFVSRAAIPDELLARGIAAAWPEDKMRSIGAIPATDFYAMAEELGGALRQFVSEAGPNVNVYIDEYSGHIVKVMDGSRRTYAWIYYGLHTLRFPNFIGHEDLRRALVLALLTVGLGFSITGVVLGFKRAARAS